MFRTAGAERTAAREARRARTMSLAAHLRELRRRAAVAAAAIVVGAAAGWMLTDPVLALLTAPLADVAAHDGRMAALNFDSVTSAFELRLRLSLLIGLIVASPVWLYEIIAFLTPGLTTREKRFSFGFLGAAVPLFLAGAGIGAAVLPHIVEMMLSFTPAGAAAMMRAETYYEFALRLMITVGIAFVVPVLLVLVNTLGLVSGRAILAAWRWAIVAIMAFTAMATPAADILGMFVLALPMIVLYFTAVGVCILADRRRARRLEAALV